MADSVPARARRPRSPASSRSRSRWPWVAGAVAAALVLATGGWWFLRPKPDDPFGLRVDLPASAPSGEPVVVRFGVAAGDRFRTEVESRARLALVADVEDLERGMRLDARLQVVHETEASPDGALRTRLRWTLRDATSDVPGWQEHVVGTLGGGRTVEQVATRDGSGRPTGVAPPEGPMGPLQQRALDLLGSGFSDPTLSFLPRGRDAVRVGEAWSLFQEVSDLRGLEGAVREATDTTSEGFPLLVRAGVVRAEGVETKGGEEALRLRVVVSLSMEGDTRPPAPPGRILLAGRGLGDVWVSRATGLPVETRLTTDLRSRFERTSLPPVERAVRQVVKTQTTRGE
jgi:hypothetical protein